METRVSKIYFDMDGVLADFDGGVIDFCGFNNVKTRSELTKEQDDLMWEKIKAVPHFYDRINPLDDGVGLFEKLYAIYGDKCELLTGIPKPKRGIVDAAEDKIKWAHRVLSPKIKVNPVFREEKKNYCTGADCILIDDLKSNIDSWIEYGGTGILYTDAAAAAEELKALGVL